LASIWKTSVRVRRQRRDWRSIITCFLVSGWCLVAGVSCPSQGVRSPRDRSAEQADDSIVLFITGSELGALKPCGCSGGQLGGLSKRPALFGQVPTSSRMVIDTGALVAGDREQDLIKFRVLFEAYQLLDYDAVNLTAQDVEIGSSLGLLNGQERSFATITAQSDLPRSMTKPLKVRGQDVTVRLATFDAQLDTVETAAEFFRGPRDGTHINIAILQNTDAEARSVWAQASGAHCLVCPIDSDDPQVFSEPGAEPLVFSPGRLGRHVVRVRVDLSKSNSDQVLHFEDIPVDETLPEDEALARLYQQYQQLVAQSGLLEKYPRIPLPDDLRYVGSQKCASCHEYEYSRWKTKAHADAFATLVEVGSDRDPECVICHVVGMERSSGFISAERTPDLKDVGCETCHGPGSEHVRTWGVEATVEPKMTCLDCHTPEHSSGYAGHEAEFLQKIVHWREP